MVSMTAFSTASMRFMFTTVCCLEMIWEIKVLQVLMESVTFLGSVFSEFATIQSLWATASAS